MQKYHHVPEAKNSGLEICATNNITTATTTTTPTTTNVDNKHAFVDSVTVVVRAVGAAEGAALEAIEWIAVDRVEGDLEVTFLLLSVLNCCKLILHNKKNITTAILDTTKQKQQDNNNIDDDNDQI